MRSSQNTEAPERSFLFFSFFFEHFCFQTGEIRDLTEMLFGQFWSLPSSVSGTQLVLVLLSRLKADVSPKSCFDSSNVQGRVHWRVTKTPRSPTAWSVVASSRAGRDGSRSTSRSSLCLSRQNGLVRTEERDLERWTQTRPDLDSGSGLWAAGFIPVL